MQNLIHIIFIFGEPQGLVLKLKLFVLAINDFFYVSNPLTCTLFTDDTTLFYFGGKNKT